MKKIYLPEQYYDSTSISIIVLNDKLQITDYNIASENLFEYTKEEVLNKHISMFRSERLAKSRYEDVWKEVEENGFWEGKVWDKKKSGEEFLLRETIFRLIENEETYYVLFCHNINENKADEFSDDALTGCMSKQLYKELCRQEIIKAKRKKQKCAVVFLDILRFKSINERYGYVIGDKMIKEVSSRLKSIIKEEAHMTRMGGDLFSLFFSDIGNETNFIYTIDKIVKSFHAEPFYIDDNEEFLNFGIGISLYPSDGKDVDVLLRKADLARSEVKENAIETYQFFRPEMNQKMFEKTILETNLRRALKYNELEVWYQPKVHLKTEKLVSFEALIRWKHPEIGYISPGKFIPIAEETGLIKDIGKWVFQEVVQQLKQWKEKDFQLYPVAVNLSALEFEQKNLVDTIQNTIKEAGISPRMIEIEITESMLIDNMDYTIETLKQLKELGVTIAVDDFGTGYSSLNYLTKLPLDALKIDGSFIKDVTTSEEDAVVAGVIISLANSLSIVTIAEGVETKEQVAFLKNAKCDIYQGFYFSPPVPKETIEKKYMRKKYKKQDS